MGEAKKPTPAAVSRFLGQEFIRSQRCGPTTTEGFIVREGFGRAIREVQWVSVEYDPGTRATRSGTPEGLRRITEHNLGLYRKHLEQRYRVTTNEDEEGEWDTLLVWAKEEGEA